jgi:preprotein translocase subunit SecA
LYHIDRCWAEYLDHVAHIRDGIHLISGGGQNALDAYHRKVGRAFRDLVDAIDDNVVETFRSATITADGIDLEKAGLKGPSSTWTYLINDNPFDGWFGRLYKTVTHSSELLKSLRRAVTYKSS